MEFDRTQLVPMGLAIILVWAVGVALGYIDSLGLGPLSVSMFAIAVIAFLGMLRAKADMRTSITAAFVTVYFGLLAALATSERNRTQFDTDVGQELWDNFTYLVGVVVLFYFGATAALEITKHVKNGGGTGTATADGATSSNIGGGVPDPTVPPAAPDDTTA